MSGTPAAAKHPELSSSWTTEQPVKNGWYWVRNVHDPKLCYAGHIINGWWYILAAKIPHLSIVNCGYKICPIPLEPPK